MTRREGPDPHGHQRFPAEEGEPGSVETAWSTDAGWTSEARPVGSRSLGPSESLGTSRRDPGSGRAGGADGRSQTGHRWGLALVVVLVSLLSVFALGVGWTQSQRELDARERAARSVSRSGGPDGSTSPGTVMPLWSVPDLATGSCLAWDQEGRTVIASVDDVGVVSCDGLYLFQVAGTVVLDGYSFENITPESRRNAAWAACLPSVEALLGAPIDPYGRFEPALLLAPAEARGAAARTGWCGVAAAKQSADQIASDQLLPVLGAIRPDDQARVWEPGTCLDESNLRVPCEVAHLTEVTGSITLGPEVMVPQVDDIDGWDRLLRTDCEERNKVYLTRDGRGPSRFFGGWVRPGPSSVAAGSRVVHCTVGDGAGEGAETRFIPRTGSLRP